MRIYHNGVEVGNATSQHRRYFAEPGDSRILVGGVESPRLTASMIIDELLFFNASLSLADISLLSSDSE